MRRSTPAPAAIAPGPQSPNRRRLMAGLAATVAVPALAGCSDTGQGSVPPGTTGRAAVLLPLSGRAADLGATMRAAATLGGTGVGMTSELEILDSGDDADSATRAAKAAVEGGAKMIIGPLFAAQARAVRDAVPSRIPVVTLSNDDSLAGDGVFVYGITPDHSAQAVLGVAASRGVRDVLIAVPPGDYGTRAIAAARRIAGATGLALRDPVVSADPAALARALSSGGAPDAVFLPSATAELTGFAAAARRSGAQILGSAQWSALNLAGRPDLVGAWFAAPDPLRFDPFLRSFEDRTGQRPGIVAGLAFDGAEMARLLGRIGQQTERGLLREDGFNGVLGPYRFLRDRRCARGLAVLAVENSALSLLAATGV